MVQHFRAISSAGIALLCCTVLTGCPWLSNGVRLGDDVTRGVRTLADNGQEIPLSKLRVSLPPAEVAPLAEQVPNKVETLVAPYVNDVDLDQARRTVSYACSTKDYVDLYGAKTWQEAADTVMGMSDTPGGARQRVASLASDLDDAESSGEKVGALAVYALCETA